MAFYNWHVRIIFKLSISESRDQFTNVLDDFPSLFFVYGPVSEIVLSEGDLTSKLNNSHIVAYFNYILCNMCVWYNKDIHPKATLSCDFSFFLYANKYYENSCFWAAILWHSHTMKTKRSLYLSVPQLLTKQMVWIQST